MADMADRLMHAGGCDITYDQVRELKLASGI